MGTNKFTAEELKQFQALPLDIKVRMTYLRIRWWLNEFDGYVSFSGGKDSTVLLHIARQVDPDIPAVFVDTGLEYPEVRKFALSQENVIRLRPEMNFRKVIETYGYPLISKEASERIYYARKNPNGWAAKYFENSDYTKNSRYSLVRWNWLKDSQIPISHYCCYVMKKKPVKKYEKETGRTPIIATMTCESRNRKTAWLKNGCNAYESKRPTSQPMAFWTKQDVLKYIKENNIPYASVYGDIVEDENGKLKTTGCDRTGCVFCAFGCHLEKEPNRFQRLKQTHPQLWEYCMKDWDDGGLGMGNVLKQINVKIE
jgi:3'-phosphoadenosine 5'-phosphosulfate sulfotransferase (PAPS reductase)/FAD synthetase